MISIFTAVKNNPIAQTRLVFSLIAVFLAPIIFLGFHPYHDGLMLSTLQLTKSAFLEGTTLPFNQYGTIWTLPYVLFSIAFPSEYFFFSTKLLSWMMILLSLRLTYCVSKSLSSHKTAILVTAIFVSSYPLLSAPVPWPSIPATLTINYMAFIVLKTCNQNILKVGGVLQVISLGIASFFLLSSRIQVGLLAFVSICLIFLLYRLLIHSIIFISSFFIGVGGWCLYLQQKHSLADVLFDTILFPRVYIGSINSQTFPQTSLLITASVLLLYTFWIRCGAQTLSQLDLRIPASGLFIIFLIIRLDVDSVFARILSRVWVGIFLAAFLLAISLLMRKTFLRETNPGVLGVFLLAISSLSQLYPLFDSYHLWWGGMLGLATIAYGLQSLQNTKRATSKGFAIYLSLFFLLSNVFSVPYILRQSSLSPFPSSITKLMFVESSQAQDAKTFNSWLMSSSKGDVRVLNICPIAAPFYDVRFQSASRFHVIFPFQSLIQQSQFSVPRSGLGIFCSNDDSASLTTFLPQTLRISFDGSSISAWGYRWTSFRYEDPSNISD